ncbi:PucR family transcriptional regulator [Streptomyces sp. NPDC002596]
MRVRELVESALFDVRVAACEHRLDEAVRWVHVTDLADPSPYLRGGELILTNALWHRGPQDSRRFVRALASHRVHALGVALYGDQDVPTGLIEACEESDVLLLVLPDVPFMDITEQVISSLLEERRTTAMRSVVLDSELATHLATGHGAMAVVEVMSRELGVACWALQRNGKVTALEPPPLEAMTRVWHTGFERERPVGDIGQVLLADGRQVTYVIIGDPSARTESAPSVLMVYECDEATVQSRADIAVALVARYLPLGLGQEAQAQRQIIAEELTARFQLGSLPGDEAARLLLAVGAERVSAVIVARGSRSARAEIDAIEAAARFHGLTALVTFGEDDQLVAYVYDANATPDSPADRAALTIDIPGLAASVVEAIRCVCGTATPVGIAAAPEGSPVLPRLLAEARQALLVAGADPQGKQWASSADVASHLLLLAVADEDTHRTLRSQLTVPVMEYDRKHGTDLIHTLAVYLDTACSWQRAAQTLHIHVNTLRYRLARIEQLTRRDLSRMTDRVDFYLALSSHRMHKGRGAGTPG